MTQEQATAIAIAVIKVLADRKEINLPLDELIDAVARGVVDGIRAANDRLQ